MGWRRGDSSYLPGTSIQRELGDVFSNLLSVWPTDVVTRFGQAEIEKFRPKVDVTKDEREVVVHAELPGIKKEDVKLSFEDGVLTISGERKSRSDKKEGQLSYVEQSYGTFSRSFRLDEEVDEDNIHAGYEDGILTVRLPRSSKAKEKGRVISIK